MREKFPWLEQRLPIDYHAYESEYGLIFELGQKVILISKYLVPKGHIGISIFPFVFLKHKSLKWNKVLVNHEKIHLQQQIELLVLPFFVIYCLEFLVRLLQYKEWKLAYRNISFEREAYAKERDIGYLKSRPLWNFRHYF